MAGTSFLSIVTIIVIACDLYRNASLSLHFCLVPFSTIYTIVSTQIATDITRGARPPSIEKTEKSRNCYRDALFDVEPRKSRPKTRKREKKRNRLLRSFHLLVLGHRYPWRNFISTPLFVALSSFFLPHPLQPSSAIAIDDGFHGRGILCESRKPRNLQPRYLSL